MAKGNRQFLQGLITAKVAIAEVHGSLPIAGMPDQTWQLICKTNERLNDLIRAEIDKLDAA